QLRRAFADEGQGPADGVCFYNYSAFANPRRDAGRSMDDLRKALVEAPGAPFAQPVPPPTVERLAKPTDGTLFGRAVNGQGQPLDTQTVTVTPEGGGKALSFLTDGNGYFAAVLIKPGRYQVAFPSGTKTVEVAAGKVTFTGKR